MTSQTFQDFSRITVAIFNTLAENHECSWFQANRERYQLEVVQPAQTCVLAMNEPLCKVYRELQADPRPNGAGSIFRIARGFEVPPDRAELICFNTIYTVLETPIPPEFYTSGLVDYYIGHFRVMRPLLQWLVEEMNI